MTMLNEMCFPSQLNMAMFVEENCSSKGSVAAKGDRKGDVANSLQSYLSSQVFLKTGWSYAVHAYGNSSSLWHTKTNVKSFTIQVAHGFRKILTRNNVRIINSIIIMIPTSSKYCSSGRANLLILTNIKWLWGRKIIVVNSFIQKLTTVQVSNH